jgi:proteic killer suppression protein
MSADSNTPQPVSIEVFAPVFVGHIDNRYVTGYSRAVHIRNFIHKGLKRLYEEGSTRGVPPDTVDKLRKMLAYLDAIESSEELRALTAWKAHMLTGDRKGIWSLSVTRNRRLTFRIDTAERELCDVNLEDYH